MPGLFSDPSPEGSNDFARPHDGGLQPPTDTTRVRESNPLLSIFFSPRATIRHVVSTNPEMHLTALLLLAAFLNSVDYFSNRHLGDVMATWVVLVVAAVIAPIAIPFSRIGAWFGEWAGSKLGGVASREEVRAAYAWTSVPVIAAGLVLVPTQMALWGSEYFRAAKPLMAQTNPLVVILLALVAMVAAIWSLVVGFKAFAEVHQFSVWRALGSAALMFLVVFVPLLTLGVVGALVFR
jgi:hypothetical protein